MGVLLFMNNKKDFNKYKRNQKGNKEVFHDAIILKKEAIK